MEMKIFFLGGISIHCVSEMWTLLKVKWSTINNYANEQVKQTELPPGKPGHMVLLPQRTFPMVKIRGP